MHTSVYILHIRTMHSPTHSQDGVVLLPLWHPVQQRPDRTEPTRHGAEEIYVLCPARPGLHKMSWGEYTLLLYEPRYTCMYMYALFQFVHYHMHDHQR